MPKHYKDMVDELVNKMDEDAPANAVAHGGVDMNPTGKKVKKKDAEDVLRRTIMKKLGASVKENTDNNNACNFLLLRPKKTAAFLCSNIPLLKSLLTAI